MQKLDIAKRITREVGITEREAVTLVDWILDLFKATLQKGEPIAIHNFGTFTVGLRLLAQGEIHEQARKS